MSPARRRAQVVDTNVIVVSNRRQGESRVCANNCAQALLKITKTGTLVLDDLGIILEEYRRYCSFSGQPGVGDYFFRWIHDNLGQAARIQRVTITPKPPADYHEFPEHDDLANFDNSDRKFIAVANAHEDKPPVLQALDTKWWGWKDALAQCGINIEFLCREEIEKAYRRKAR